MLAWILTPESAANARVGASSPIRGHPTATRTPNDRFNDLDPDPTNAPLPLYAGAGFDEVQQLANECDITVIG